MSTDPTWLDIASALAATKLAAINAALTAAGETVQLRSATAEVPDALPSGLPCMIAFPPALTMEEEGQNEFYEATFSLVLPFDRPGSTWQALSRIYLVVDAMWAAFRTGRQLGLPGYVIDSHLVEAAPDVLSEWDATEKTIGIRASCIVEVRRTITRTP